jgi:hypothetical protein
MAAKERLEKGLKAESKKNKPTGRQLFERDANLALSDVKMMDDGDVAVDASLFEDEDVITDSDEEVSVAALLRAANLDD